MDQPALARLRADVGQLAEAADQRIRRGAALARLQGMRRHAGGLVGHDDLRVGVDDADGQLGLPLGLVGRGHLHRDARAGTDPRSLGRSLAVDADAAVGDPVHRPAAADAEEARHRPVEPVGGHIRRDDALLAAHERASRTCVEAQEARA